MFTQPCTGKRSDFSIIPAETGLLSCQGLHVTLFTEMMRHNLWGRCTKKWGSYVCSWTRIVSWMVVCRDELFTFNIICAEVIRNAHFLRDTMKVKNCTNRNPFIAGYFWLVMLSSAVGISLPWKASFLLILKYIGCLAICKIQFGINNYFLVWLVLQNLLTQQ